MAKETFARKLPHLNVGVIGHQGHGKTTLTSAITKVLAKEQQAAYRDIITLDRSPDEHKLARTIITSHVEYSTFKRHVAHIDCPGHRAYGRNVTTGLSQLDAAILVVSAADGFQEQTREHIVLARQAGIDQIVVFLSKCDLGDDAADRWEIVEEELRGLLSSYDFPGDSIPFVYGSAFRALDGDEWGVSTIKKLLEVVDAAFVVPARDTDRPFLMPIADALELSGQGTVVTGTVRRGALSVGEEVELVGLTDRRKTVVTGIETFNQRLNRAEAGDHVGLKLRGVKREDVHRGQVVAKPGTVTPHTKVEASLYFLTKDEGGRSTPVFQGYKPQLHLHAADVPCTLKFSGDTEMIMPGDHAELPMEFMKPLYVQKGDRFALRDGGRTVALGTITSIIV
jgi:elongation factor Tu